jgi:sec-independent protein translocase protein TatC
MPAIKEYLTLVLKLLFAFGMSFQIPIVIMLLVRLDLVSIEALKDKRRYVIVWAFIFAAVLTPPDIISQTLLALPMLMLYELGIIVAKMSGGDAKLDKAEEESL